MLGKTTTALLIVSLGGCHPAFAEAPCEYDKTVETNWTQQIEKTSNIDRKVFPYVEDTRKCMMTMDVTINGQTYPAEGSYVFGPDMSENDACDNATVNAKKSVISEVSPEILSAKTEMNCSIQDKPVVAEAPTETVTIQESTPVIQEGTPVVTERVISRKLVDSSTNNVVSYIPSSKKTITIGGFTIGFADGRTPGKCYANWATGGTDCY